MKSALVLLGLLIVANTSAAQPRLEAMDEAIDRGLAYLQKTQRSDGSWPVEATARGQRRLSSSGDLAVTALSVMAFLSAGHVPGEGPYRETVDRGIRFVLGRQSSSGHFAVPTGVNTTMYYQGIGTLMLAEVSGMVDGQFADEMNSRLAAAVKVILQAQRTRGRDAGGWRYEIHGSDADLSVTGWQLLALRAARNVGCDVPSERIQAAVDYVKRCRDPRTGGYTYTVYGNVTVPCTGTGVLTLQLCDAGYYKSSEATSAAAFLMETPLRPTQPHYFYGLYYVSQAMFQLGETLGIDYWKAYRQELHRSVLQRIPQRGDGAWIGRTVDEYQLGPAYCTAMAVLALTVEYRLLPIYQRSREPMERDSLDE